MIITSDEEAEHALNEIGALQAAVDSDSVNFEAAGVQIVERLEALMVAFSTSTTLYATLVEPIMGWAIHTCGPKFIMEPESPEGRRYKALYEQISEFYDRHKHLNPEE